MTRSASWSLRAQSTFIALSLLLATGVAHAGGSVQQAHPFKVKGSIHGQSDDEKNGQVIDGIKFSEKLYAANCLDEEKLPKGLQIILSMNDACGVTDLNANDIQIVSTDPFTVIQTIGQIDFDDGGALVNEKKQVRNILEMNASLILQCDGTLDVDIAVDAIATVKFNKEGTCVETVTMKNASGGGDLDGEGVLVDRVKGSAGKPKADILAGPV